MNKQKRIKLKISYEFKICDQVEYQKENSILKK